MANYCERLDTSLNGDDITARVYYKNPNGASPIKMNIYVRSIASLNIGQPTGSVEMRIGQGDNYRVCPKKVLMKIINHGNYSLKP